MESIRKVKRGGDFTIRSSSACPFIRIDHSINEMIMIGRATALEPTWYEKSHGRLTEHLIAGEKLMVSIYLSQISNESFLELCKFFKLLHHYNQQVELVWYADNDIILKTGHVLNEFYHLKTTYETI